MGRSAYLAAAERAVAAEATGGGRAAGPAGAGDRSAAAGLVTGVDRGPVVHRPCWPARWAGESRSDLSVVYAQPVATLRRDCAGMEAGTGVCIHK